MSRFNLSGLRLKSPKPAPAPPVLLLVGIHREELAFGVAVARGMDKSKFAVLEISEGLSGQRPLPGESFHYDTLHEALYRQLVPHMTGHHRLLIDLHTGSDSHGTSVDLICADAALRERLQQAIAQDEHLASADIRVIPLGDADDAHARTVIPREIWDNPDFSYLGMEVYLPENGEQHGRDSGGPQNEQHTEALNLSRRILRIAESCIEKPASAAR